MKHSYKRRPATLVAGSERSCPDLRYVSGFCSSDPVILIICGSRRHLVVPDFEVPRARRESLPGTKVYAPSDFGSFPKGMARLSACALRLAKRLGQRRVRVSAALPVGIVKALEAGHIRVEVAGGSLVPAREVKSSAEIRHITDSQRAAVAGMKAAMNMIRTARAGRGGVLRLDGQPLTAERVRARIDEVLLAHNCTADTTIVAGGRYGADPHETGQGPLRTGELIVMDIFPRHRRHGYWGDLSRTVLNGTPSDKQAAMHKAVCRAQKAALKTIRAGVPVRRVHAAACRELEKAGFKTDLKAKRPYGYIHSTGHGVGLEIHEAPSLADMDGRLKAGNVITVEPGLYYPRIGGVRIEDTVLVTKTGWRYLVPCAKGLL